MATLERVIQKINLLIEDANDTTGSLHNNLRDAVDSLILGYGNVEVDSLSNLHAWSKYTIGGTTTRTPKTNVFLGTTKAGGSITIAYADAVDTSSGQLALSSDGYGTIAVSKSTDGDILKGKAVHAAGKYYEIPETANVWLDGTNTEGTYRSLYASEATEVTYTSGGDSFVCIVVSEDSNAYPQNGEQDGYKYVYNGTLDNVSVPVLQDKNVTPSASQQVVKPDSNYDGLSQVTVAGDADLLANNIRKGVSIFNVTGTYGGEPSLQNKSVTPSAKNQVVVPDTNYDGLAQVTVAGDADLVAGNIKKGVEIFGVTGSYEATGGIALPTLTNPGSVADLASGKQLIDADGNVVTGNLYEYTENTTPFLGHQNAEVFSNEPDGVPTLNIKGQTTGQGVVRKGAWAQTRAPLSMFGDATAADVAKGKTFTSAAGLTAVGTNTFRDIKTITIEEV